MRPCGRLDTIAYSQHLQGQGSAEATGLDSDVRGPAVGRRGAQTTGRLVAPHRVRGQGLQQSEDWTWWTWISLAQLSLYQVLSPMVPHGLEPRTLRLLAVRSNQLSYETVGEKGSEFTLMLKNI